MAPRDKLLEPVRGVPLLRDRAQAALAAGAEVVVTLPPDRPERRRVVADLPLRIVIVPQASEGMGASIAAGASTLGDAPGVMILPADMPGIRVADLAALLDAFEAEPEVIHRGASGTRPGHPVIFPSDLIGALTRLRGDEGARAILRGRASRIRPHPLPHEAALIDLDTPEAWDQWRTRSDA